MKAIVKEVVPARDKRVIAISDIHGNLNLFQRLLAQAGYTKDDILVLVGDLIEKGPMSLATLRYIMELANKNEVYVLSGNCDTLWEDIKYEVDDENLLRYMVLREKSILNEMCMELSIEVNAQADIKYIKEQIGQNYSAELNWLEELPHIIDMGDFVFAHAGLMSDNLREQKARTVMKTDAFLEQGLAFSRYVVVGHWPTANYWKEKGCCNPITNEQQRIICIDGGNMIRGEGQLNALIINDKDNITFTALDDLVKAEVVADQAANSNTIHITWMDNAVEVLRQEPEFSLCRHVSSQHELWIKNNRLFEAPDGMRCYDCTDFFLPVAQGDIVSIVERSSKQTLAKKDGTIGWVANEKLKAID